MHIWDRMQSIENSLQLISRDIQLQQENYNEGYIDKLVSVAERNLENISSMYLSQRELLLSLYDFFSSRPRIVNKIEFSALKVSVKALDNFTFPVYKITLPYLIPNKREKKATFKNAVTNSVLNAVTEFCEENHVTPIEYASLYIVSSHEKENLNVDNDNKESVVITNGLIGKLIMDDRASRCNTSYYFIKSDAGAKTEIYVTDNQNDLTVFAAIKSGEI